MTITTLREYSNDIESLPEDVAVVLTTFISLSHSEDVDQHRKQAEIDIDLFPPCKIANARLKAAGSEADPFLILFIGMMGISPADAVIWAYDIHRMEGKKDIESWCSRWPDGIPSRTDIHNYYVNVLKDESISTNLLDVLENWN